MGSVYSFCTRCFQVCVTAFIEEEMEIIKEEIHEQVDKKIDKILNSPSKQTSLKKINKSPKKYNSPEFFEKKYKIKKKRENF